MTDENRKIVRIAKAIGVKVSPTAREATEKADEDERHSLEIRTNFFDRLATLDAGSIAVAVSVGIALFTKASLPAARLHGYLGSLAWISVLLWLSLVSTVFHNFLSLKVAKLDADRSHASAESASLVATLEHFSPGGSPTMQEKLSNYLAETTDDRNQRDVATAERRRRVVTCANISGYAAVVSFLLAYLPCIACVVCSWWLTR